MSKQIDFFLGASSPSGFASFFHELSDPKTNRRLFVIKSGPGTGKSGLMKSISAAMQPEPGIMEHIHCSSDPDSLDGVIFHDLKAAIIDGTAPHTVEPNYPGCFEEVVNLYDLMDNDRLLKQKDEIVGAFALNQACHKRCRNFLQAAKTMISDSYLTALKATDAQKIGRYAKRVAVKEFSKEKGGVPVEHKRLLSAVTPKGVVMFENTAKALCDRVYLINDDHGASANLLLSALRSHALSYGLELYTCFCPLSPYDKIEHLFLPDLKLGFMTQNRYLKTDIDPYRVINFTRFTDAEALKLKKQRLSFNRKAAAQLIAEAVNALRTAKEIHDQIETYYISSMDFSGIAGKRDVVLSELRKLK